MLTEYFRDVPHLVYLVCGAGVVEDEPGGRAFEFEHRFFGFGHLLFAFGEVFGFVEYTRGVGGGREGGRGKGRTSGQIDDEASRQSAYPFIINRKLV